MAQCRLVILVESKSCNGDITGYMYFYLIRIPSRRFSMALDDVPDPIQVFRLASTWILIHEIRIDGPRSCYFSPTLAS